MAEGLDDGEFWLPSEFLTTEDILMEKENLNTAVEAGFCFPTVFPYDVGSLGSSPVISSPVESVAGSTETESDEEDLLTGWTCGPARSAMQITHKITCNPRNVEKRVVSGSPESTLSAVGSWSGRSAVSSNGSPNGPSQVSSPSPLSTNNASWDLIYAAAEQVARLKMSSEGPPNGCGVLCPRRSLPPARFWPPANNHTAGFYTNQCLSHSLLQTSHHNEARQVEVLNPQQQCASIWGKSSKERGQSPVRGWRGGGRCENGDRCGRPQGLPQSPWPPLQAQHQHQNQQGDSGMRAVFLGGSAKRKCSGTGVFLPRRYGNPPDSRKKAGCSTALLPPRVVHALNKNFNYMTAQPQPRNGPFFSTHDAIVARRNALLTMQRRSLLQEGAVSHDVLLPQEWTY